MHLSEIVRPGRVASLRRLLYIGEKSCQKGVKSPNASTTLLTVELIRREAMKNYGICKPSDTFLRKESPYPRLYLRSSHWARNRQDQDQESLLLRTSKQWTPISLRNMNSHSTSSKFARRSCSKLNVKKKLSRLSVLS